ncbi:hypothetical protein [Lysinibacillus xylanilyticus]
MWTLFKIRKHCLSVAKAKRQLQLRQGEIEIRGGIVDGRGS